MASRIIRDSYPTSETVASMEPGAQDRLPRYWLTADDFGCFLLQPAVIRGRLFPLREDMSVKKVTNDLEEFVTAGLLTVWEAPDGKKYAFFAGWWEHNRKPRSGAVRKTPPPPFPADPPPDRSAYAADPQRNGSGSAADPRPQSQSQSKTQTNYPLSPPGRGAHSGNGHRPRKRKAKPDLRPLWERQGFPTEAAYLQHLAEVPLDPAPPRSVP